MVRKKTLKIFKIINLLIFFSIGSSAFDFNPTSINLTISDSLENLSSIVVKEKSQSKSPKLQISNGKSASDTQFPYVAELEITDSAGKKTTCSASLIGFNWLLTAKQCIP